MKSFLTNKGFTLMEVMSAAAILAFSLCGLILLFVKCSVLNGANRNLTSAISHAQYVMADIRNSDFVNIESAITNGDWDWNEPDIESNNLVALRNESIDANVLQSGNPLGVYVGVQWTDRDGRMRNVELRTLCTYYQ